MTQDFAKRHSNVNGPGSSLPGWVWFITGLVAGIFVSFLAYVWKFVPPDPVTADVREIPKAEPNQVKEEMQYKFYDLFPNADVPVVEEYNAEGERVESFSFLLQAGSFRDPDDADELRGQLILLGLDVFLKETNVNGNTWHRVMVGPLDTNLALNRAQDKLAEAEIESIPLKIRQ
jgi:cell division protein FtsN